LERRAGPQFRRRIVSARSGVGGKIPPVSWDEMKEAVRAIDGTSLNALERLERLRDQSHEPISRRGADIVSQERDAVGMALDVFDETKELRKRTLRGWAAAEGRLTSFLDGLEGVRISEDQLIA